MKEITQAFFVFCILAVFSAGCGKNETNDAKHTPSADSMRVGDSTSRSPSAALDSALSYEERQGKFAYDKYCAVCHGTEGKGDGFNAFNLDPKPRDFSDAKYVNSISEERLILTITGGGRAVNRSPLMPAWGGRLNKLEIQDIAAYLRTLSRTQGPTGQ